MKATGIVRRIDDLGRVVIPKEIRRTMRIREGDPLEIFTEQGGEVVFKKYSPVGEMTPFTAQYTDVLARSIGLPVMVCDRDTAIAASGLGKKEWQEKAVTAALEELMEARKDYTAKPGEPTPLRPLEGVERHAGYIAPIAANGDVIGVVCILQAESGAIVPESDIKLAQVAATFLGKQLEE